MSRLMHPSEGQFRDFLFQFQAPRADLPPAQSGFSLRDAPSTPTFPIGLYDRHIPQHLILKRVELRPSLVSDICSALDAYTNSLDALPEELFAFPTIDYDYWKPTDARSLEEARSDALSAAACQIASSLLISPTQPYLDALLLWSKCDLRDETLLNEKFCSQHCHLKVLGPEAYSHRPRNDDTTIKSAQLFKFTPCLITGMFFSSEAQSLLRSMGDVADEETFTWKLDSKCSGMPPSVPPPPDASDPLWGAQAPSRKVLPRRSSRMRERVEGIARRVPNSGVITASDWFPSSGDPYHPSPEDYIQKVGRFT